MRRPKSPWYTANRHAQEAWRHRTETLPDAARGPGLTWVSTRDGPKTVGPFPVCLPLAYAEHNLLPSVRELALERFARHRIAWHHATRRDEGPPAPSTHLLDSQVQCVNTLLSLAHHGAPLMPLVQALVPDAASLVPIEDDHPVAFEWDGGVDWLHEIRRGPPVRGQYRTSVDAFLVAERADGGRTALLIEWKFTETYPRPVPFRGRGGTDRREVYRQAYERAQSWHTKPPIDTYFHEPHYQQLRLVLLAEALVEGRPHDIDRAIVVDAIPAGNHTLLTTIPEGLRPRGATVPEVWRSLIRDDGPVTWAHLDTTPWVGATEELEERYGPS